jgi:hypothetical protein
MRAGAVMGWRNVEGCVVASRLLWYYGLVFVLLVWRLSSSNVMICPLTVAISDTGVWPGGGMKMELHSVLGLLIEFDDLVCDGVVVV